MALVTILFFFTVVFSLGLGLALFAKESENFLERNLMRLGIGLGAFITLGLLLNLIHIPLDYKIFLGISILCILSWIFKNKSSLKSVKLNFKLTQTNLFIFAMLVLFFITFYMYQKGAFSYPYLEDDDSWSHAIGAKYVSVEKTVFAKGSGIHYIDPYPPAYDMVMGILNQTNSSLYWTMKFFNALIISLSIIFFYFFASTFADSPKKALFSTFALFAIPAFLSHFIWSIAITMPLFFVSFYALEKIKDDWKWIFVSAVIIAAALTSSPSHSTYFALLLLIYLLGKMIPKKKTLVLLAGFLGFFISAALWWIPMVLKHGLKGTLAGLGTGSVSILTIAGTADRTYSVSDFVFAKSVNMINNPIGIGLVISSLLAVFLIYVMFKYSRETKKQIAAILFIILLINGLLLFALHYSYVKNPAKRGLAQAEKGSVPFLEFLSDQIFLLIFLAFIASLTIMIIAKLYKDHESKDKYLVIIFLWTMFSFYAVNAAPFYYRLSPFRAWMLLAIPVALLCGESINLIINFVKAAANNFTKSKILVNIILVLAVVLTAYGITTTSFVQKYAVNTALWSPGGFWTSNEEIQGYVWFKDNIPADTRVFTFSNNALIIGFDKFICSWCPDVQEYQRNGFNKTAAENYNWLKRGQYKYMIIDGQATRKFGVNDTNNKIRDILSSNKFKPVFGNNGMIILSVT